MSDDIIQGADGSLVAEFRLAERMHRQNVISNTYETVTCAAERGFSFHQCADVAGAATIAEDEASTWSVEAHDVYYGDLAGYLDISNAQPFGVECGSERVGDGVVNSFDIAVFAFAMFNTAPFNVALTTETVVMRSELAQECNNKTTRADWQAKLATSFCPVRRRNLRQRRLSESESDRVDFWEHARVEGGVLGSGTWFRISIHGLQSVVELVLDGIWVDYEVGLVNEPYPRREDTHTHFPANFNKVELRWARKFELLDMKPTAPCSPIVNGVSGTIAMEGDTIGVRQEGDSTQLLCAFVVFIYVPDTVLTAQPSQSTRRLSSSGIPTVGINAGSTWRYPKRGSILELDATPGPFGRLFCKCSKRNVVTTPVDTTPSCQHSINGMGADHSVRRLCGHLVPPLLVLRLFHRRATWQTQAARKRGAEEQTAVGRKNPPLENKCRVKCLSTRANNLCCLSG